MSEKLSRLARKVVEGETRCHFQFAGNGGRWFPELQAAVNYSAEVEALVRHVSPVLKEASWADDIRKSGLLSQPIDLLSWLTEGTQPSDAVLASSTVSQPLIYLTQAVAILRSRSAGFPLAAEARLSSVSGHSQGMMAAVLMALGSEGKTFAEDVTRGVIWMLRQGFRMQEAVGPSTVSARLERLGRESGDGVPSPMASIGGLGFAELRKALETLNHSLPANRHGYITLMNAPRRAVVSAPVETLLALREKLIKTPGLKWDYLATSAPFHSPYMESAMKAFWGDYKALGFGHRKVKLRIPVYETAKGENLQQVKNLDEVLVRDYFVESVDWTAVCRRLIDQGPAVVVDLGPDEQGLSLTRSNTVGFGISVLSARRPEDSEKVYSASVAPEPPAPWATFAPVSATLGKAKVLVNRFTALTGYEPVVGGGMTPTTGTPELVAAASAAGFIVELAGGGQPTREALAARLDALKELLPPGRGFVFNALYLDPYLWKFQVPMLLEYRRKGYPIMGVTISGGVPPKDEAVARLRDFFAAGIRVNSLKAGSDGDIERALAICDEIPEETIILQVEGGLAGGHHSMHPLETLLEKHYRSIRERRNVVLVAGGGIDSPARANALLNGSWVSEGVAPKPVDAVLVGTVLMTALEAMTSEPVKDALVKARGERKLPGFGQKSGDVISGRSSLDADIYFLDNHAAKASFEIKKILDSGAKPEDRKAELVALLAKTCKPYFGEVEAMTYLGVLRRLQELLAPGSVPASLLPFGDFFDQTYFTRFQDFARRAFERVCPECAALLGKLSADNPKAWVAGLAKSCPQLDAALVSREDADFFLASCDAPGKPVNFIPVIDARVHRRLLSDSLWQAHDPRYDASSVFVIPGPSALQCVDCKNRPAAELLGQFLGEALNGKAGVRVGYRSDALASSAPACFDGLSGQPEVAAIKVAILASEVLDGSAFRPNFLRSWMEAATSCTLKQTAGKAVFKALDQSGELFTLESDGKTLKVKLPIPELDETFTATASFDPLAPVNLIFPKLPAEVFALYKRIWGGKSSLDISRFKAVLGDGSGPKSAISTGFVEAWSGVTALMLADLPVMDFTKLLHLTQEVGLLPEGSPEANEAAVTEVLTNAGGTVIEISARAGHCWSRSAFFVRGEKGQGMKKSRKGLASPFATDPMEAGSTLGAKRLAVKEFFAPSDTLAYADSSNDRNPLHLSRFVAMMAGFERPVVHGMWTLNRSLVEAESYLSEYSERLEWAKGSFLAPVFPGDPITLEIFLVGFADGARKLRLLATVGGKPVMEAQARARAPRCAYLFTGQGSQFQGMGLALAARSKAAAEIWDRADKHLRKVYGFSIRQIVKDNPKVLSFRGTKVSHPKGVLNLTQFTQVALSVTALAQDAHLKASGLKASKGMFAGHSLGEYAALGSLGIINLEKLLDAVYWRGLTMQNYVPRDAQGRSPYGMSVLRPSMAGLSEQAMLDLVEVIAKELKGLLQVVNYNIAGRQYSVVGELPLLKELEKRLLAKAKDPSKSPVIPIPGIDVPFHSRQLLPGVEAFREVIRRVIPERVDPAVLEGRYIPNLMGKPFTMTLEFIKDIVDRSSSPELLAILKKPALLKTSPETVCATMLRELLSYQFASPVQWIDTQRVLLFRPETRVSRIVELGPSPVLTNMAKQSVQVEGSAIYEPEIYHAEADEKGLTMESVEEVPAPSAPAPAHRPAAAAAPAPAAAPTAAAAAAPAAPATAPGSSGKDPKDAKVPFVARIQSMLAYKLGGVRPSPDKSVEALCEGNSARRNEVMSDLKAEYSVALEGAHTLALKDLANELAKAKGDAFHGLGGYTKGLLDKMLPTKISMSPAQLVDALKAKFKVPEGVALDFVAVSIPEFMGAKAGLDAASADAWVKELFTAHLRSLGCEVSTGGGGGAGGPSLSVEEVKAMLMGKDSAFVEAVDALMRFVGRETPELKEAAAPVVHAADVEALFEEANRFLAPAFDERKVVVFSEPLACFKRDLLAWFVGDLEANPEFAARYQSFKGNAEVKDMVSFLSGKYGKKAVAGARDLDLPGLLKELATRKPLPGLYALKTDPRLGVRFTVSKSDTEVLLGKAAYDRDFSTVLISGAGPGSIAESVVAQLLLAGKRVIVTSSTTTYDRTKAWRHLFQANAAAGATLTVLPANGGSRADMDAVVRWCFKNDLIPELVLPFGAIGQLGYTGGVNPGRIFAAARIMLLGVGDLAASLAAASAEASLDRKIVLGLPLSPNHGQFGGDGIYAEIKLGLEALLFKARSEPHFVSALEVCGISIGWTRGTGLMSAHDAVAASLEKDCGVRTFNGPETAGLIMHCLRSKVALKEPLIFAIHGGIEGLMDLGQRVAAIRSKAVASPAPAAPVPTRYNPLDWNPMPTEESVRSLTEQASAWKTKPADPTDAVVVVGFGEVSPYGNSLTRWQLECFGTLSLESAVELAWMMGLIEYRKTDAGATFVDAKSGQTVPDWEVKARYEEEILAHTGVRFQEEENLGVDHTKIPVMAGVLLEKDFEFNPGDRAAAQLFLDMNPTAKLIEKDGALKMVLPKGSMVRVTRALRLDRWVAGQIPRGWNASRYGIPDRIVKNVDPVTLFNLAATAEAFITMGLTPQELMTYIHPAFVGNTQGSGMGGLRSIAQLFQNYREDRDSRGDILQETLINVTAGWLVQDYIGGMGPAYNPVGACATAAVSIAAACDMLDLGRAELVVAGGFDDISIEGNLGFTWMQATARTEDMLAKGIEAKAHSRSNDCRRGGFIEGQGGATLLMSTFGKALELGLPIYGVVAMAETHTDGFATSIPSPGLGLLAMAGECGRKDSVMARALKRWGLTVDDILVSSKHDTSTLANDVNESKLLHLLHSKLGRSAGNPLVVHSQKTMIGHAKGGAAGPQAIAVLQMLQSGRIPGNPNLDNPDRVITAFKEILLTDRTLQLPFVSAGMISSLGFGHMGAAALFVNPGFAFKTLSKKDLEAYLTKLAARRKVAGKRWADRICSNAAYVSGSDPRDCEQIIFGACK